MKSTKYLTFGFVMAICVFMLIGTTNVRTLGNSDNGRNEFYLGGGFNYLLDTQTGDM